MRAAHSRSFGTETRQNRGAVSTPFLRELLPQDYEKAALWYRRAAERGDVDAQLNIGLMHARGIGVKQSFLKAFKWFELAVIYSPNSEFRDKAFFNRENAASMLDRKEIEKAERWASTWKPKVQ